jgi:hypothetical protein
MNMNIAVLWVVISHSPASIFKVLPQKMQAADTPRIFNKFLPCLFSQEIKRYEAQMASIDIMFITCFVKNGQLIYMLHVTRRAMSAIGSRYQRTGKNTGD